MGMFDQMIRAAAELEGVDPTPTDVWDEMMERIGEEARTASMKKLEERSNETTPA
jgi:hypothetical protein